MATPLLGEAAQAFDAVAERFDQRYGEWRSVAAQRRAVRRELQRAFPHGARLLEVGGGTGEDARWLETRGREVLLTDASPAMVRVARAKLRTEPVVVAAEELASLADARAAKLEKAPASAPPFDGAFSNFAALNCVPDLAPVARGLARLVRPGAPVVLVLFGVCAPGEWLVQLARRDVAAARRRFARGPVPARLGGRDFAVWYHTPGQVARAFRPWFRPAARRGIGVFVPPSAAEPWISGHPRLLTLLEALDRAVSRPLALLGDHVLYRLERTSEPAP